MPRRRAAPPSAPSTDVDDDARARGEPLGATSRCTRGLAAIASRTSADTPKRRTATPAPVAAAMRSRLASSAFTTIASCRPRRDAGEHAGDHVRVVEPVDLVDHHVREGDDAGVDALHDDGAVALVHLEHGDVAGHAPLPVGALEQRRGQALADVRRRRVGEDVDAVRAQDRDEHLRGRRLAARPRDDHEPLREARERARQVAGRDAVDDETRERPIRRRACAAGRRIG